VVRTHVLPNSRVRHGPKCQESKELGNHCSQRV